MKYFFFFISVIFSHSALAQDSLDIYEIDGLGEDDTLYLSIKNRNCYNFIENYYMIYKMDSLFTLVKFDDFQIKLFLDGKELSVDEKRKFLLESWERFNGNQCSVSELSENQFSAFLKQIISVVESDNETGLRIAGTSSVMSLELNDKIFSKTFRAYVNLKDQLD